MSISKRITKFFTLLFLLISILIQSELRAATLETKLDTSLATIGDQLHLTISARHSEKHTINFPQKEKIGNFEVIDRQLQKAEKADTSLLSACTYQISAYDTGQIRIPSLSVKFQNESDTAKSFTMNSQPLSVNIISVLASTSQNKEGIKDIKPPFPIPTVLPWDIIIFVVLLLIFSLGCFLSGKKWKDRQKSKSNIKEEYKKPPHIVAFNKLKHLKSNTTFPNSDGKKQFYSKMSKILREYMERRFFILAPEMSTTEIIKAAQNFNIEQKYKEQLQNILSQIDLVKYAQKSIDKEEALEDWDKVYTWVEDTKKENIFSKRTELTEILEENYDISAQS